MNRRSFFSKLSAALAGAAVTPLASLPIAGSTKLSGELEWPYLINRRFTQGYFICDFEALPLRLEDYKKYVIPILHERTH